MICSNTSYNQAVFPLNTVLFPGSILSLQIFEQRYLDLIKFCMKGNHGFVVVLISSGKEVNDIPDIYSTGTYVEITDWETLENGLLAITVTGIRRVSIIDHSSTDNGLMMAQVENFNEPSTDKYKTELEGTYNNLVETLQELSKHSFISKKYSEMDYSSPIDVCHRLSELLPASNLQKQDLLETCNINSYIGKLDSIINSLSGQ